MTSVQELLLKVTTLLAFCGGPMVLADALEPRIGDPWHFVVAFTPIAMAAVGTFSMFDREHDLPARLAVWSGFLGAAILLLLTPYGAYEIAVHPDRGDRCLVSGGLLVGTAAGVGYLVAFRAWLAADAPAQAP